MNKLQKGVVKLKYVPTEEHVANVLTKPLSRVKLKTPSRQAWCSPKRPPWKNGVSIVYLRFRQDGKLPDGLSIHQE